MEETDRIEPEKLLALYKAQKKAIAEGTVTFNFDGIEINTGNSRQLIERLIEVNRRCNKVNSPKKKSKS